MNVRETITEVASAVLPIAVLVTILQFTIARFPAELYLNFIFGAIMLIIGLAFFLIGSKLSVLPVGELVGSIVTSRGKLSMILFFGFVLGFVVTVAEPDLQVLATQVAQISEGTISKAVLISAVSLGVGIFVAIALLRVFFKVPLLYLLIGGYILAFWIALFSAPEFIAVAFDSGGVTTGPMTVPFILALGIGVSAVTGKRKASSDDTFGLVGLASLGPILTVLIMGVIYK